MKLARTLNPRATHENTLVMRSSLDGDEDQGAELPVVARARTRVRCVPDQPVNKLRSDRPSVAVIDISQQPSRAIEPIRHKRAAFTVIDNLPPCAIAGHVQAEFIFDRGRKGLRVTAFVVDVPAVWPVVLCPCNYVCKRLVTSKITYELLASTG
jgi:hypothetical protein